MPKRAHQGIVVLAEDDDDLRESVQDVLEANGYLVLGARNGIEALSRMRGLAKPVVAVVDLVMPQMNGHELISAMRAEPDLESIPVVVVSSYLPEQPVPDVAKVLHKPHRAADLLAAVRELGPRAA